MIVSFDAVKEIFITKLELIDSAVNADSCSISIVQCMIYYHLEGNLRVSPGVVLQLEQIVPTNGWFSIWRGMGDS